MKDIYDVLKEFEEKEKQESARSGQIKADTAPLEAVKEELQKVASTEPVDPPATQEPVSYTHLDVYKRQRSNRSYTAPWAAHHSPSTNRRFHIPVYSAASAAL